MNSRDGTGWGLPPWKLLMNVDASVSRLLADGKRRTVEEIAAQLDMRNRLDVIRYALEFLPNYAEVFRENHIVKYTLERFRKDDFHDRALTPVPIILIGPHASDQVFRALFKMPNGVSVDKVIRELNQKCNQVYFYEHPAQADTYVLRYPEFGSQLVLKPGDNKNTYFAVTYKYRRGKLPANARQISVQYVLAGGGNRGATIDT